MIQYNLKNKRRLSLRTLYGAKDMTFEETDDGSEDMETAERNEQNEEVRTAAEEISPDNA